MGFYHTRHGEDNCPFRPCPRDSRGCGQSLRPQKRGGPGLVPAGRLMGLSGCSGQRHFCVFAVSFPGQEALPTIYSTILAQHLAFRSVPPAVQRVSSQLVASALGKLPPHHWRHSRLLCGADGSFIVSPGKYFIYTSKSIFLTDAVFQQAIF